METSSPAIAKICILVADTLSFFHESLVQLINLQKDLACCGEAHARPDLMAAAAHNPRLILLEVGPAANDGLERLQALAAQYPHISVLAISPCETPAFVETVLRAGAQGYVLNEEPPEEILHALRTILRGEQYLSRKIAVSYLCQDGLYNNFFGGGISNLTKRELQIFRLLGARLRTKRIAADLGLSIKTVEAHRESIRHKLGLRDARSLFDYAFAWAQCPQAMALPADTPSDSQRLRAP